MASVTLTALWVANSLDLTTSVLLYSTSLVETPQVAGSVRAYANGRQRVVSGASKPRTVAVTPTLVSAADAARLASWAGQLVLLRDPFGLKVWGSYFSVARTQQVAPNVSDLTFTLTEVTFSEAV